MTASPLISFVMATQNRRDVVLSTLEKLHETERSVSDCEIIVAVNPSTDGTAEAIRERYPDANAIQMPQNRGSCAKAAGVEYALGRYVVFLDDDSYPRPGSVSKMIEKFEADDRLGAAGFMVYLPDGRRECSALPNVFIGCGVGFRREVLAEVGGLDGSLFMQAEEYDLSFRLIAAGWKIQTFADLAVDHLKTTQARLSGRTVYYDTRNNLILISRYLPDAYEEIFKHDWQRRYYAIAADNNHRLYYWRGRIAGWARHRREREAHTRWRLSPEAFEKLFHFEYIANQMKQLSDKHVNKIVLADLGKNIYPFVRAAKQVGLSINCIADDRFFRTMNHYRGIPIVPVDRALATKPDAIIIANASPVHAEETEKRLNGLTDIPIERWFGYDKNYDGDLDRSLTRHGGQAGRGSF